MVKFKGEDQDGKTILGFGLSELNLQKLREGMPIRINNTDFFDGTVIILYGKTEKDIEAQLYKCCDNNTKRIEETNEDSI